MGGTMPEETEATVRDETVVRPVTATPTLLEAARTIVRGPSLNRTKTAGYDVKSGERVLLVEKSTDDPVVTKALVEAMTEIGASVDVFHIDIADRELEYVDEFRGMMHNFPGIESDPAFTAWAAKFKWLERVAQEEGYSLLLQGEAGPIPILEDVRYEGIPWYHRMTFPAAGFPWPLWDLINKKAWEAIWTSAKGATVHVTDPEGTDLVMELDPLYWEADHYESFPARRRFEPNYYLGHLYGWPTPPYAPKPKANGVVAGTLNHYSKPFPHCKVTIKDGFLQSVEGGGGYGDLWRDAQELTADIKYPEFPEKGMFWLWEVAIGTHPKMVRPPYAFTLSGHAAMYERLRSGYIHIGIGTANGNPSESWAEERGLPWGHIHIHLQFPTYVIHATNGDTITVIKDGHLTALDDPEVVAMAERYGEPANLLAEAWIPPVPGVSLPGDYWKDYAPDPNAWLLSNDRSSGEVLR
jgi:hypothetical protein